MHDGQSTGATAIKEDPVRGMTGSFSRLGYLWQMPRLPPSQSAVMPGLLVGLASGFRRTCQQPGSRTSGT
jgi:hypothetical protein